MKFNENPYYSPELCGLELFYSIDTADSYEFDIFAIWKKLDDGTLWYDTDSGCSCPSPFDNCDHGHDLKPITKETFFNFEQCLSNHNRLSPNEFISIIKKVKDHLN